MLQNGSSKQNSPMIYDISGGRNNNNNFIFFLTDGDDQVDCAQWMPVEPDFKHCDKMGSWLKNNLGFDVN